MQLMNYTCLWGYKENNFRKLKLANFTEPLRNTKAKNKGAKVWIKKSLEKLLTWFQK